MKDAFSPFHARTAALVAAAAFAVCGLAACPAVAQTSNLPSYATSDAPSPSAPAAELPSYARSDESIRGRVTSFDGKYGLAIRDDRGFIDNVSLHDGTVINPTGLRLAPGQSVTIHGRTNGKTFAADEIDTAYVRYPAYVYGPYPYPYVYPAFGIGFRTRGFGYRGWF